MNNHIVLDVSSDEDYDKGENFSNWLDEFLEVSDEKPKSTALRNSNSSDSMVEIKDEDDDDCVILDCDPMAKETVIDTCETDEVLVTGQKGEIACRDFPHPRHDCAKYQFKSTLHQQYCEMCHCYVCDTRAPCPYWYSGFSNVDHCHANDKEEIWKTQREWFRDGNMLPRPVSTPASIIPQMGRVTRPLSVPSSPITQFGVRACSTSTKVATHPNTRPRYRTEQSGPRSVQSYPNHRGGSYNGKPSPKKAVSSYPYTHTRRPRGVYRPENCVQNIAQGSQATRNAPPAASLSAHNVPLAASQAARCAPPAASQAARYAPPAASQPTRNIPPAASQVARYAPPAASQPTRNTPPQASQGNPQRIVTGYISTVPESPSKVYARQFNLNMYSAYHQTNTVPSESPNPPANQQQQKTGISSDKVLSEFEDWLLDDSTPTGRLCPLFSQDNATTFKSDFETFLK